MSIVTVAPGAGGPPTHVHAFDQFHYVLDGQLTVEVGLDLVTAGPHSLVVLPAGVPHSHRNDGAQAERHISLIAPEPAAGDAPWDTAVVLAPAERPPA